jgi:hypothetical protein
MFFPFLDLFLAYQAATELAARISMDTLQAVKYCLIPVVTHDAWSRIRGVYEAFPVTAASPLAHCFGRVLLSSPHFQRWGTRRRRSV